VNSICVVFAGADCVPLHRPSPASSRLRHRQTERGPQHRKELGLHFFAVTILTRFGLLRPTLQKQRDCNTANPKSAAVLSGMDNLPLLEVHCRVRER